MTDPLEPSATHRARMDQMHAAMREVRHALDALVAELVSDGWTDEQARTIVVHALTTGRRP